MNRRMFCPRDNQDYQPTLTGHSHETRENILRPIPKCGCELKLISFLTTWVDFLISLYF